MKFSSRNCLLLALFCLSSFADASSRKNGKQNDPDHRKIGKEKGGSSDEEDDNDIRLAPNDATCIYQANFTTGSLIIYQPGSYKLCEDIVFDPNPPTGDLMPAECFDPVFDDGYYDENMYGLGFFAAIVIASDNVNLFLNSHTLEQSPGHALMQRFYANIEIGSAPFIAGAGPAMFVGDDDTFQGCTNVSIFGPGILGLASHHGIHGNNLAHVEIAGITFKDFEVAAVSLNKVDYLKIHHNHVKGNRKNVPVTGMFSAARFIRQYGLVLKEKGFEMMLRGKMTKASDVYDALVDAINNVYADVVEGSGSIDGVTHPMEFFLFDNKFKVIEGPSYAFLVHGLGPAVGGQGFSFNKDPSKTSSNIVIHKNVIENLVGWNKEIPAAVINGVVQNDARGAVFQFIDADGLRSLAMNHDGTYKGNVVADMQIMAAKAIITGELDNSDSLQTGINTIDPTLIEWAESNTTTISPLFRCNADSMHHVAKGMIVIRVENTQGFVISGNKIRHVRNLSLPPFAKCNDFHAGSSIENFAEQQMGNVRAISVAATKAYITGRDSVIADNVIRDIDSVNGNVVIGVDIQGETSGVDVDRNKVDLKTGVGTSLTDKYVALRIRSYADGSSIEVGSGNKFKQEIQNLATSRRLRGHGFDIDTSLDFEWENSGCPFARKAGQKRVWYGSGRVRK